jgi:hypothetical protein
MDLQLTEIVLFELPGSLAAQRLLRELATERLAWLQDGESAAVVGALLSPDPLDFARLLRDTQAWLDRSGLAAIRYEVDGRTYVLEARLVLAPVG